MKFLEVEKYGPETRDYYASNIQLYMEVFLSKDTNRKLVIEDMQRKERKGEVDKDQAPNLDLKSSDSNGKSKNPATDRKLKFESEEKSEAKERLRIEPKKSPEEQ